MRKHLCYHRCGYSLDTMRIIVYTCILGLLIWGGVVLQHYIKTHMIKYKHFPYSELHYYLFLSPLVLAVFCASILTRSSSYLSFFLAFGAAGMIGELLFSFWWKQYFGRRFWKYELETTASKYTSYLNFIPWGLSGFIYTGVIGYVSRILPHGFDLSHMSLVCLAISLGIFLQYTTFYVFVKKDHPHDKIHHPTHAAYILFFAPLGIGLLVALCINLFIPFVFIIAGLVATAAEYCFGKATQFLISKKLWNYTYLTYDNNHFTPLAIPAFILGGIYYWMLYLLFIHFR